MARLGRDGWRHLLMIGAPTRNEHLYITPDDPRGTPGRASTCSKCGAYVIGRSVDPDSIWVSDPCHRCGQVTTEPGDTESDRYTAVAVRAVELAAAQIARASAATSNEDNER
jgi:hypothetical protein